MKSGNDIVGALKFNADNPMLHQSPKRIRVCSNCGRNVPPTPIHTISPDEDYFDPPVPLCGLCGRIYVDGLNDGIRMSVYREQTDMSKKSIRAMAEASRVPDDTEARNE